jgi:uncharacterized protein
MRITMRPYPEKLSVRNLRLAALLCFGWLALLCSQQGSALTRTELYHATAPLADRSEAAQTTAFQTALRTVLVRVTGNRAAEEDAALAPLVANARRYVQQYRAAPDGQIWVAFDGAAIERWLTQNGQPVWSKDRPATFVWLAAQTGGSSGAVITAEDNSELKAAVEAAASQRGLPLIWPSAADAQRNRVDYSVITAGSPSTLADVGRRLGGEAVLIGKASNNTGAATVRWVHLFQDRSSEFSGTLEGVNRAADLYASLFAASGSVVPVEIEVTGVNDLKDYAALETYLESQTFIAHVSVLGLSADTVRFSLATRGGGESLQRALGLNGKLKPIGAGENGIQRFQLHR